MYWKKNLKPRIASFCISVLLTVIIVSVNSSIRTREHRSFFIVAWDSMEGWFSNIAKILIIFPMLLSKYKPLSYMLTLRGFSLLSHLMLPMMAVMPIMYLRYYYEQHQMLTFNFYQMIFYSIGTYIFSMPFAYFSYMLFKAPITAYLQIFKEAELVSKGEKLLRFDFQFIDTDKLKFKAKKE